ncbi:MAG: hypothetical protein GEU88_21055, partial [Solirubrobacterales bacterium]|nr:hypothetical protein [Solirubrobacterales bacterium]
PRLVDWISIVDDAQEIERLARYTAVLMDRIGPFKLRADLDITVDEVREPHRIHVRAAGEDRQVGSRLVVDAVLEIEPDASGAHVRAGGTYEVTGRVAAMGGGTIRKKAERILDNFFGNAERELGKP